MDPLSVAASVAGLVSVTIQVSGTIGSYCNAVKDAPRSVQEINQELLLLLSALQQLNTFLSTQALKNSSFEQSSILATALISCRDAIIAISAKLPTPKQDGRTHTLDKLKWPFGEKKIQQKLEELRRCTSIFQFALTIEGCNLLSQTSKIAASSLELQLHIAGKILEMTKDISWLSTAAIEVSKVSKQVAEMLEFASTHRDTISAIQAISDNVRSLALGSQEAKEQQILEWLSAGQHSYKHRAICARRLPGTGQWLLDCGRFRSWLEQAIPVLWCTGGPGVGKSVLTSLVIDHISHRVLSADKAIAYYYFDYREQEAQTSTAMVASLLRQLAGQRAIFPPSLLEYYENFKQDRAQPSMPELLHVFNEVCRMFSHCYIIVDALDECYMNYRKDVLRILKDLDLATVQLFMTSRPHSQDIVQSFHGAEQVQVEASEGDIKTYCHRMIDDNYTTRKLAEGTLRAEITEIISRNAQGMFLLPVLQMTAITEALTKSEIRRCLKNLSANLTKAFEDTLRRIGNESRNRQKVAIQSLMWISHARSPLRIDELRHALATQIGDTDLDRDNLIQPRLIIDCCSGLVVVEDESSLVKLVHHTLQDFLQTRRQNMFPDAEIQIVNTCLSYLCLQEPDASQIAHDANNITNGLQEGQSPQELLFLGYASAHWGDHARQAASKEADVLALKFLSSPSLIERAEQSKSKYLPLQPDFLVHPHPLQCLGRNNLTGLHLAARFGLTRLIILLLTEGFDVNAVDSNKNTALHEAARYGNLEAARILLLRGAEIEPSISKSSTPLNLAVLFAHKDIVLELLKYGADPNQRFGDDWTPLHLAADKGHIEILKALLRYKASISSISVKGLVALHRAAGRGHLEIIRLLLSEGSHVDDITHDEWTPLHGASSSGQHEAARLLLEHGAAVDHQSADGRTPLHRACRGGHYLTVMVLLENGANCLIHDSGRNLPLHRAAKGGYTKIIKLLLDRDPSSCSAQVLALSVCGRTPRAEATYSGHWETASLLKDEENLQHGLEAGRRTILEIAIAEGNLAQVQDLLKRGTEVGDSNADGMTPLHQALLLGHESIAVLLLRNHANIKARSAEGWEPLHCAAKSGVENAVRICLDHGANIAARTTNGQTALHKVCKNGNIPTTQLLIERGADLEARDSWGWRPLHTASAAGFKDIVELLVVQGADLGARDKKGCGVQACAAGAGHHALVEYLRYERYRLDAN